MRDRARDGTLVPLVVTSVLLSGLLAFTWIRLGRRVTPSPELSRLPASSVPASVPVWSNRPRDGVRTLLFPLGQDPGLRAFRDRRLAELVGVDPGTVTFVDWVVVNESDRPFEVADAAWRFAIDTPDGEIRTLEPTRARAESAATRIVLDSLGFRPGPYRVPASHAARFLVALPGDHPPEDLWVSVRRLSGGGSVALRRSSVDRGELLAFRLDPSVGIPGAPPTDVARRPDEAPRAPEAEDPGAARRPPR